MTKSPSLDEILALAESLLVPAGKKLPIKGTRHKPGATALADALPPTKALSDIGRDECRWPYDGHMACGRAKERGAYCAAHATRAYVKGSAVPLIRKAGAE